MKLFSGQSSIRSRYPLAIGAGLVLASSFPKLGIAGFAWVSPAFLVFAAGESRGRKRFKLGFVAGFACWLVSLYWLLLIPVRPIEKFFPFLGWIALSAFAGLYHAIWVLLVRSPESKVLSRETLRSTWSERNRFAVFGAISWVGLEMIRARFLSGFPWNPLGASQYELTPLINIASVTGVYGVSFLVVWMALSLYNAAIVILREPTRRFAWQSEIFLPLAVLITVFGIGFIKLKETSDRTGTDLRVAFIQPDISQRMIWNSASDDSWFRGVLELTQHALSNETDLVLWPEAGTPKLIRYDDEMRNKITDIARAHGVWMILGSDDAEPARNPTSPKDADYFNSSFLINPQGEIVSRYCKRNLVIFGEYVPLVRWLPFIKWLTPITGGFKAGDRVVKFDFKHGKDSPGTPVHTATLICFEDIFPHLVREYVDDDTDFLVNLTNNGWFGEGAAQWQHAAAAVFRAVENGVPLLRCSNNGLTCWVDERGRIRQLLRTESGSVYGAGVMRAEIPIRAAIEKHAPTFYRTHGDWFGWACVVITVIGTVCRIRASRPEVSVAAPSV